MKALSVFTGADTAGIGIGWHRAFYGRTDVELRSLTAATNYIGYEPDVAWTIGGPVRWWDWADVVISHTSTHGHDWYDKLGTPLAAMHHGMHPDEASLHAAADAFAGVGAFAQMGSTANLVALDSRLVWMPAPVDVEAMQQLRARLYQPHPDGVVRIGHAPTDRGKKGTPEFCAAIEELRADGLAVEAVLIERASWRECLRRKAAEVDVFYDQPGLGYGSNAIEAWAMGIPVLAGMDEVAPLAYAMEHLWGGPTRPFWLVSRSTMARDIRAFLRADVEGWGKLGLAHVRRHHAQEVVADRLANVLADARPSLPGKRPRAHPVPRSVYDPVPFWEKAGEAFTHRAAPDGHDPVFRQQERELMGLLHDLRHSVGSVLEVGIGWGRIAQLVKGRWPELAYTGLDLSADQLAYARRTLPPDVVLECSTFQDWDAKGRRFDLVLASEVLMHVRPKELPHFVAKMRALADVVVVTIDYVGPSRGLAPWNFAHDYKSLLGPGMVSFRVGQQALMVTPV